MTSKIKPFGIIVEDSISTAKIFSIALEKAGYITEIILDGATAQQRLAEITPDILIIDLHLPFATGEEILQHTQTNEQFKSTTVIIATADANFAQYMQTQENVDFVMLKPISMGQLRQLATRLKETIVTESYSAPLTNDRAS